MNTFKLLATLTLSSWLAVGGSPTWLQDAASMDYETLKTRAEELFAEGSFAQALELFERAGPLAPDEDETRWVRFRTADSRWRSAASTQRSDQTEIDRAHEVLRQMASDVRREEDRDVVWAELQESLGDFHWLRREVRNFGAAWPF